ncbi:recombinase XerC [Corynebacterium aquilae DSM 44791]|uniref:Recombinase XerC n=1 Tax=Corynebacterium aquilae DSM 44791 TaxID=1431546 RepID=A0A1L7CFQ3_9CORY|nr:recombinase XerC [Corynebacterium aquilae DSM 44791]
MVAAEFVQFLVVEKQSSRHTVSNYRRDVQRYASWLKEVVGQPRLGAVTDAMVEDYVGYVRTGDPARNVAPLALSSANRALVVVRQLHAFGVREQVLSQNVAKGVQPAKTPQHFPDTLTVEQVMGLIDAIPSGEAASATDLRDRALLEVLYGTGARISEVLALSVQHVRGDGDFLTLTGKGNKQRQVPVGEYARHAVDAYVVRARPSFAQKAGSGSTDALFLNQRGGPLSRQSAWAIIQDRAHRAGIEEQISPHTFRHSYATHLVQRGVDVRTVQELLGHSAVTTTQLYMHMNAEGVAQKWAKAHPRSGGVGSL